MSTSRMRIAQHCTHCRYLHLLICSHSSLLVAFFLLRPWLHWSHNQQNKANEPLPGQSRNDGEYFQMCLLISYGSFHNR